MPATRATAPGKSILFGEHAVVYGYPAIAVPITQVRAAAVVSPSPGKPSGAVQVQAPEIALDSPLNDLPLDDAIAKTIELTLAQLGIPTPPAFTLRISSTIPLAAGLGSGAAVSAAISRAVSAFLGHPLPDEAVNAIAFEVEKIHHGTPSGIDNTVVTYARPVYFIKGQPIQTFNVKTPFTIVIGDTGIKVSTAVTVGDVRQGWQADPEKFEPLFEGCGQIAEKARTLIETGQPKALGALMDENQTLLEHIGVSSPELETLIDAARKAGALGAKLSGGGRGGNMIALVPPGQAEIVAEALRAAGAANTITATIGADT